MHYGVVDESNELAHYIDVPLPGPRLPHDMASTENHVILNDFPLFWDPQLLEHDVHLPRFYPDIPSRFAVIPRRGRTGDIRWFEADPTFVLHFTNAYEDGDEIVLDGFFEARPSRWTPVARSGTGSFASWRWIACRPDCTGGGSTWSPARSKRSNCRTRSPSSGRTPPHDAASDYRYTYAAAGKPGWFLFDGLVKHDLRTGGEAHYQFGDGVYGSEAAMAPRSDSRAEDDGYLITLTTDMNDDASYCLVFDVAPCWRRPGVQTHAALVNGFPAEHTPRGRLAHSCVAGMTSTSSPARSGCECLLRPSRPSRPG